LHEVNTSSSGLLRTITNISGATHFLHLLFVAIMHLSLLVADTIRCFRANDLLQPMPYLMWRYTDLNARNVTRKICSKIY